MPDIAAVPNIFAPGDTTDAVAFLTDLWKPKTTENTAAIINGGLDHDNLKAGVLVPKQMLQRRSQSAPVATGATANLDYLDDLFADVDPLTRDIVDVANDDLNYGEYINVPGACLSFFVPWSASIVALTWNVYWGSDASGHYNAGNEDSTHEAVNMRLFVQGLPVAAAKRSSRNTLNQSPSNFPTTNWWSARYWA